MAITVTLVDVVVNKVDVDYDAQCVRVLFSLVDAAGKAWTTRVATFWITMPEVTNDLDFLLPASYVPPLLALRTDADSAITSRFLG